MSAWPREAGVHNKRWKWSLTFFQQPDAADFVRLITTFRQAVEVAFGSRLEDELDAAVEDYCWTCGRRFDESTGANHAECRGDG